MSDTGDNKPLAGLSLDLDNEWSYMKTHGDAGWKTFPSYFDAFIPEVLDTLKGLNLKITFFVVGQDAALEKNARSLAAIAKCGHEIGNHSFHHEPWLQTYSADEIQEEILAAESAILSATGQKPLGFRGPGFSWSPALLETLARRGYLYDASTFPTFIGPLGRLYYFARAELGAEEKKERKALFGRFREGFRPVKPYIWFLPSGRRLLEIPVTTVPILKTPFHLSYLLYLGRYSEILMRGYLETALALCRLMKAGLSFLLHPLDFFGSDEFPGLAFFPGMDIKRKHKLAIFRKVIKILSAYFHPAPMGDYVQAVLEHREKLPTIDLGQKERPTIF
jgi:peptidoglycan/xylan/chitin deacetylase (PgdA/CDA1 family)